MVDNTNTQTQNVTRMAAAIASQPETFVPFVSYLLQHPNRIALFKYIHPEESSSPPSDEQLAGLLPFIIGQWLHKHFHTEGNPLNFTITAINTTDNAECISLQVDPKTSVPILSDGVSLWSKMNGNCTAAIFQRGEDRQNTILTIVHCCACNAEHHVNCVDDDNINGDGHQQSSHPGEFK